MRHVVGTVAAFALSAAPLRAQDPRVGAIDFYGIRTADKAQIQRALGIKAGDTLVVRERADLTRIEARVLAVPRVRRAHVAPVCCENGRVTLYVGIDDGALSVSAFRVEPTGTARLSASTLKLGNDFDAAMEAAILRGVFGEDESQGHSLSQDSATRRIQQQFPAIASRDMAHLRDVMRTSADSRHRALASQIIAYAPDKRDVIADLVYAMHDANSSVRNAATRALWVIATYAQKAGFTVPFEPFIDMLNSLIWTDVNKSSLALAAISERRDPALLDALRAKARPALLDIARWKAAGHSQAGLVLLGRIAGMDDKAIFDAIAKGDKERILRA